MAVAGGSGVPDADDPEKRHADGALSDGGGGQTGRMLCGHSGFPCVPVRRGRRQPVVRSDASSGADGGRSDLRRHGNVLPGGEKR